MRCTCTPTEGGEFMERNLSCEAHGFPEFKNLEAENESLRKKLEIARDALFRISNAQTTSQPFNVFCNYLKEHAAEALLKLESKGGGE